MGVVAQPEMRVLYWGYDNIVEGTASGFDPERVTLRGSNGVRLVRQGNGSYIAKVDNGTRNATISVAGTKDDGSSVNLGSFQYKCKPFPQAQVYVQGKKSGEPIPYTAVRNLTKVKVAIDPASPITTANYKILGGDVYVTGIPGGGKILPGGNLDANAKSIAGQSRGKNLVIEIRYQGPDKVGRVATYAGKVQ